MSVAGESLKKVLNNGHSEEMNKAMMFLVQKSTSGAVDGARTMPPRPSHSVSIELIDDNTEKVVGEPKKANEIGEVGDLIPRKRSREDVKPQGPSTRRAMAKSLTIVGSRGIVPCNDPRGSKGPIAVEIRPHERWTEGSTVPMRAFRIFHLPQDVGTYAGRPRGDLVDRCLSRVGRVSFNHLSKFRRVFTMIDSYVFYYFIFSAFVVYV